MYLRGLFFLGMDQIDELLYSSVNMTRMRLYIVDTFDSTKLNSLMHMKPLPMSYAVFGPTSSLEKFLKMV